MSDALLAVTRVAPDALLPAFAALYGAPEEDMAWMVSACTAGWVAVDREDTLRAAVGARPSPQHGAELLGGAFPGEAGVPAALAVARAAHADVGAVYVFADGTLFPPAELVAAGFREVGSYRRLEGRVPYRHVSPPDDVTLRVLADVPDVAVRLEALGTHEDRVGHHAVQPSAALDGAGGFDSHLSAIAFDREGRGIGICRVAVEGGVGRMDSPGVHPRWRHTALRSALLNAVNARLRHQGVTRVSVDSWGDTPAELAHDLALGLSVVDETPILALG
ncbi:GNAT superfamily N-acetyltransferase [Deinococcus metalli]|uniref:GNAT superfamily N-acetyltransferase n=1 Tax=Deinococcus metalli TaxID=1141878 RepID=A0A7W8KFV4_9DEIO|nr:hypothetical protein [Deinococcus metalli]MBB5377145.1 GNAT superfamily N-acetyltransferase [Deinococcus metalli]GHF48657.1 hypothetical protein GCM10017781_26300 [Deinococcus metalli]